jgi:hypothetical protein
MKSFTNIDELKENIPDKVFSQLKHLIHESTFPDTEESLVKILEAWLTKRAIFNKILDRYNLKKTLTYTKNDPNACIAITLSGSILALGPLMKGKRHLFYSSISMRADVPPVIHAENAVCEEDGIINKAMAFTKGPIQKTSPLIDIGVVVEEKTPEEQLDIIKKINDLLRGDFIRINKAIISKEQDNEDLVQNRNDLFNKWIIIEWFLIGGLEKHIFLARAKLLWLELFTKVYEALMDNTERDDIFLYFTNKKFAEFIDVYKWYESEKKHFDIGLMKALEEIPSYDTYKDFVNEFLNTLG